MFNKIDLEYFDSDGEKHSFNKMPIMGPGQMQMHLKFEFDDIPNFKDQATFQAGLYTWAYLIDHKSKASKLAYWTSISTITTSKLLDIFKLAKNAIDLDFCITKRFKARWSKDEYEHNFHLIPAWWKK